MKILYKNQKTSLKLILYYLEMYLSILLSLCIHAYQKKKPFFVSYWAIFEQLLSKQSWSVTWLGLVSKVVASFYPNEEVKILSISGFRHAVSNLILFSVFLEFYQFRTIWHIRSWSDGGGGWTGPFWTGFYEQTGLTSKIVLWVSVAT